MHKTDVDKRNWMSAWRRSSADIVHRASDCINMRSNTCDVVRIHAAQDRVQQRCQAASWPLHLIGRQRGFRRRRWSPVITSDAAWTARRRRRSQNSFKNPALAHCDINRTLWIPNILEVESLRTDAGNRMSTCIAVSRWALVRNCCIDMSSTNDRHDVGLLTYPAISNQSKTFSSFQNYSAWKQIWSLDMKCFKLYRFLSNSAACCWDTLLNSCDGQLLKKPNLYDLCATSKHLRRREKRGFTCWRIATDSVSKQSVFTTCGQRSKVRHSVSRWSKPVVYGFRSALQTINS